MEQCIFYHYWFWKPEAYNNLNVPVIPSIATLRGVNPDVPIVVLDCSDHETDYGPFPELLNFKVERIVPTYRPQHKLFKGSNLLSRIMDIYRYAKEQGVKQVVYSDCDAFWLKDPFPLELSDSPRFCFNGNNTGFFYYNTVTNEEFHQVFHAYNLAAIYHREIREIMKRHVGYADWFDVWDEMTTTFMYKENPGLIDIIPKREHGIAREIKRNNVDVAKMKMFHCNGTLVANEVYKADNEKEHCRGLVPFLVEELYDNMCRSIPKEYMDIIYSKREQMYYKDSRFSLIRNPSLFIECEGDDHMFHLERCLKKTRRMWI